MWLNGTYRLGIWGLFALAGSAAFFSKYSNRIRFFNLKAYTSVCTGRKWRWYYRNKAQKRMAGRRLYQDVAPNWRCETGDQGGQMISETLVTSLPLSRYRSPAFIGSTLSPTIWEPNPLHEWLPYRTPLSHYMKWRISNFWCDYTIHGTIKIYEYMNESVSIHKERVKALFFRCLA